MKGRKASTHSLLLMSQDRQLRRQLRTCLLDLGLSTKALVSTKDEQECLLTLGRMRSPLIVLDDEASPVAGITLLHRLREQAPQAQVMYVTAHHGVDLEREVRQLGVLYYTEKPLDSILLNRLLTSAFTALFDTEKPPPDRLSPPAVEKRD